MLKNKVIRSAALVIFIAFPLVTGCGANPNVRGTLTTETKEGNPADSINTTANSQNPAPNQSTDNTVPTAPQNPAQPQNPANPTEPVAILPVPPTELPPPPPVVVPPAVVVPPPVVAPPVVVAPPAPPATHQVHRLSHPNGDHMLSRDPTEGSHLGYIHDGPAFNALTNAGNDTQQIYRCSVIVNGNRGDHFTSNDPQCEGRTREGQLGHLYANEIANTIAVYRCNNPILSDHMTTTNPSECHNAGYIVEGSPLGYAPR